MIVQVSKDCYLPWTKNIQDNFQKLLLNANDYIPEELFRWELKKESKMCKLNKGMFRSFVAQRGWSNLLTHSQAEIN